MEFLSTPSARRATQNPTAEIFIKSHFYPRPPRGGRPLPFAPPSRPWTNFYPRPPRGGRLTSEISMPTITSISIHALREEGDHDGSAKTVVVTVFLSTPSARRATIRRLFAGLSTFYFYPRPPRGGRQADRAEIEQIMRISIHALREEGDWRRWKPSSASLYFYPRPPRGGRR